MLSYVTRLLKRITEKLLSRFEAAIVRQYTNINFYSSFDWFVDNKLSIHFGEDKTKSILFVSKRKIKKLQKLEIIYNNIRIKQHSRVTYLGCILEETMSGESMANKVISKVNARLKFLHRKNKYLTPVCVAYFATL